MLGHLADGAAIVDLDDPGSDKSGGDREEESADRYALALLTGTEAPLIHPDTDDFGAWKLAMAALTAAPHTRIEPGTLAMCYAHQSNNWAKGVASLRYIYQEAKPVWREVNGIAAGQLDWSALSEDTEDYVKIVMGHEDA